MLFLERMLNPRPGAEYDGPKAAGGNSMELRISGGSKTKAGCENRFKAMSEKTAQFLQEGLSKGTLET
jgi:hypothetical protein